MTKSELLKQFKKGEVVVRSTNENVLVEALIYKGLAVHQLPAPWVGKEMWSITHIKSGTMTNCGIGSWPKRYRWKALFLAWALAQEADWTICRSKILRRKQHYRAAAHRAMQYTLSESKG